MNYTQRASLSARLGGDSSESFCNPGSREDFLRALELLSVRPPQRNVSFHIGPMQIAAVQVAYLRCTIETWREIFGSPERVEVHAETVAMFPVEVWTYQCVDGPLVCIGHQVDDLHGQRWVTFVRLCHF